MWYPLFQVQWSIYDQRIHYSAEREFNGQD